MTKVNSSKYTIEIRLGEFEGETCYEAKVKELPSLAEYADTHEEAYALALDSIETLAEMHTELGRPFPQPLQNAVADYSGRVTLRLPRGLHQSLAIKAEEEAVSLNALLANVLASYVGFGTHFKQTTEKWQTLENKTPTAKSTAKVHNLREYQNLAVVNE
ncbi:toxin-antitoxin system HicB family antitoxin [Marinospirillum insulare]|uniref:Toxin-antitoxin system HicB family antitoxin n=1 Tax=Marinospirillum insulare TaxID=217169 RepID=A0ABQ5ZXJ3_9GAMM|nr:toxin-antitoxin system HicB family antitoxin [Marinospirillum insulare]GLR63052.1 hypothetical protein GCM10007878_04870 [Marinospirillum insulare]